MTSTTMEPRSTAKSSGWTRAVEWRRIAVHAVVIFMSVVGLFFAHEIGHFLAALFFGARILMFNVLGMQWYPHPEWMPQLGFGGYVSWLAPLNSTNHRFILMAGSNFTMLLSITAVMILSTVRVRGLCRTALAVISLYSFDSVLHALPAVGVVPPGWSARFTVSFSEAYFAAVGLGMPGPVYLGAVIFLSILACVLLGRALRN